ncbi:amidohydrolase [Stachybotrys elegans]|uniref:Amidohydrolase n=1 Tax=Stachybotrys elegans TaxID=80388 RepID=A0A8K0ST23_9HYPO|nr:amidohydrolase [Stachybotrys elegans]
MPVSFPKTLRARPSLRDKTTVPQHALHRNLVEPPSCRPHLRIEHVAYKARLTHRIPPGSWDSHMHVLDPDRYPLAPGAAYRPSRHTLRDALTFETSVGIRNIVLVQPSIYGHDNSCLLDALYALGPRRGRGVVSFDPATTPTSRLCEWHTLGVRGVRLNIQSHGVAVNTAHIEDMLEKYAAAVRPLGWVVQVYMPMSMMDMLEDIVPRLGVRLCIDHLGHPCLEDTSPQDPYQVPGFASLARLLQQGRTFVKLSAPYRMSRMQNHIDLEPMAREIIRLKGKSRVVFATDWPHTRFEGLDIRPWMDRVLDWCGDDKELVKRLFKENAEDLWDTAHV